MAAAISRRSNPHRSVATTGTPSRSREHTRFPSAINRCPFPESRCGHGDVGSTPTPARNSASCDPVAPIPACAAVITAMATAKIVEPLIPSILPPASPTEQWHLSRFKNP